MASMNLHPFYKVLFVYIDPLLCLSGVFFGLFDHTTFIKNTIPSSLSSKSFLLQPTLHPLTTYLITLFASFYLFIFILQTTILRASLSWPRQYALPVWRAIIFGLLAIDVFVLGSMYRADPQGLMDVQGWTGQDWGSYGIYVALIAARSAFLLGVGTTA